MNHDGNGELGEGIRQWREYANKRPVRLPWLDAVPQHWATCPVWTLFALGRGRVISNLEIQDNIGPYPVYSSQTESNGVLGSINTFDFDGEYLTWTTDGAKAGTVFHRVGKFNCTNVCGTLKPRRPTTNVRFFEYALNCATSWFVRHDINPKLMNNVMGLIRVPLPEPTEQRHIATLLDRETAKIDALVAKKERLIELLQEKRTALISHAVTKGLDPNVPMKDSGVEWLGEIPKHWEVRRLKTIFQFLDHRRIPLSGEVRATMAKVYPYYGASGIIDHVEDYLFEEPLILVAEDGANLYSRSSPLAFIADGKYWVNNHAHILKPLDGQLSFWESVLATIVYDPWITGSAQPKLNSERLGTICLPYPSIEERKQITTFLKEQCARFDSLIAKVQEAIDKLREFRTALISSAVTGKIDVREEVG